MQTSRLLSVQLQCNNIFAMQHKNDNTAFHRRSTVSGGLALLRGFCQWKIEHQVGKCRLCERFDTEEHGWARERCRPSV